MTSKLWRHACGINLVVVQDDEGRIHFVHGGQRRFICPQCKVRLSVLAYRESRREEADLHEPAPVSEVRRGRQGLVGSS